MNLIILVSTAVSLRIISNPLANVFQKQLTAGGIDPLTVNSITYLVLSIICVPGSFILHWPLLTKSFWLYSILGGIAGALGNGFLIKALQKGDLSVLGPVNSYKSVVGLIAGMIFLSEVPGIWGICGVLLIVAGSYFVLDTLEERFSFAILKRADIQFRLLAMILTAVEAVFIKKVILSSSAAIAFISWCFFGAFFSFIMLLAVRTDLKKSIRGAFHPGNLSRYILLVICIGTMQFTTNISFKYIPVGYALALFQLSMILSIFFGLRFFQEKNIGKKLIGSLIMITGSVIIILLNNS
jgi:drug/metabolite transporter (DMT)-like permease